MIDFFYIFAIIIVIGIFYLIPIVIIYSTYKFAKKKLNVKIANSILTILIILFLYVSYADFHPLENRYKRNFDEKSNIEFADTFSKYLADFGKFNFVFSSKFLLYLFSRG